MDVMSNVPLLSDQSDIFKPNLKTLNVYRL